MADTTIDTSNLGSQIQGLLSQFAPSPELRANARNQAQLQFFLGLLGAPKGLEARTIGQSGLLAQQGYQNYIKDQQAQTGQNMQLAMPLLQMLRQQQYVNQFNKLLNQPAPTMNGPDAPFQTQGGASGLLDGATGGAQPGATSLPTQVPDPGAAQSQRDALANLNISGHLFGMPDMSGALKFKYPDPIALRPNAAIYTPGQGFSRTVPAAPPGYSYDFASNAFIPVSNGPQAEAKAAAIPKAVGLAYEPQTGILPNGGEGVTGSKLDALFGGGPLPFAGNLTTGVPTVPVSSPAAAAAPASGSSTMPQVTRGPVQTKLSPEQEATYKNMAEYEQSVHSGAATAVNQDSRLNEMQSLMGNFTPGPTLPMRSNVAGYLQDIPGVGQSLANLAVPNSKVALPAIQSFNKLATQMVAEQAKVFGSREAVQIVQMVQSAIPNSGMVPGAPQTIFGFMQGMNQYAKAQEAALAQWKSAHNNSALGFQEYWHATNPATKYIPPTTWLNMQKLSGQALPDSVSAAMPSRLAIPMQAANALKANPALRDQFDAKYGIGSAASVLGQ